MHGVFDREEVQKYVPFQLRSRRTSAGSDKSSKTSSAKTSPTALSTKTSPTNVKTSSKGAAVKTPPATSSSASKGKSLAKGKSPAKDSSSYLKVAIGRKSLRPRTPSKKKAEADEDAEFDSRELFWMILSISLKSVC